MKPRQERVDAHRVARLNGAKKHDFDEDLLGRGVSQAAFGVGQDLHYTRQRLGRRQGRLFLEADGFVLRNLQQLQIAARDLVDNEVSEMVQQVGQQPPEVLAVPGQLVQLAYGGLGFALEDRQRQAEHLAARGKAEHREHVALDDLLAAKTDELVQGAFRVAQPAIRPAGNGVQRFGVNVHLLLLRNVFQVFRDERSRNRSRKMSPKLLV